MDYRKYFLHFLCLFFFFLLSFSFINSTELQVTTDNDYWSYEIYTTDNSHLILQQLINSNFINSNLGNLDFLTYIGDFRYFIYYNEDFVFTKNWASFDSVSDFFVKDYHFSKYGLSDYASNSYRELLAEQGNICSPVSAYLTQSANDVYTLSTGSSLAPPRTSSGNLDFSQLSYTDYNHFFNDLMPKYYYMKTFVFMKVSNPYHTYYLLPDNYNGWYTYNSNDFNQSGGTTLSSQLSSITSFDMNNIKTNGFWQPEVTAGTSNNVYIPTTEHIPYVLLKPGDGTNPNQFTFSSFDDLNRTLTQNCYDSNGATQYCGQYSVEVFAIPVDGKCDFNPDGILDNSEYQMDSATSSFNVEYIGPQPPVITFLDANVDATHDYYVKNFDVLRKITFDVENSDYCELSDGTYNERLTSIGTGATSTAQRYEVYKSITRPLAASTEIREPYYIKCHNGDGTTNLESTEQFNVVYKDSDGDTVVDYLDGENGICANIPAPLNSFGFYDLRWRGCGKWSVTYCPNDHAYNPENNIFHCSGDNKKVIYNDATISSGSMLYVNVNNFGSGRYYCMEGSQEMGFCDFALSPTLQLSNTWDSSYSSNILLGNEDYNYVEYVNTDGSTEPITLPEVVDTEKYIYTYKNNVLQSKERPDAYKIAIAAHKIKNLKSKEEAQQFVDDTYRLMTKFDIIKNITETATSSRIEITLRDVPQTEQKNITIYQIISKDVNYEDIVFLSDGGAQRFVKEKDPIIGWYFNDSGTEGDISYEIPEGDGGDIIVTQEPILYNEGDLVINYRQTDCNIGEAQLFELDDLEDSKVYAPGAGKLYKVCVAHLTENLQANDLLSNSLHIADYINTQNISLNQSVEFINPIDISVDNDAIYWDLQIQETNPTGDYSCIGSVNNDGNSLFGDCGYTQNRIWLHLGADLYPPTTTLDSSIPAHSIYVTLNAQDNIGGSGLDKTYYCVGVGCTNFEEYTNPFQVTCETTWGCIKTVRYYSIDLEQNQEPIVDEEVKLLDVGSSCQADCTAKPSPNRFLKECNNLNSCSYYEKNGDDGEYVAQGCDLLVLGSYANYNATHEIMCPLGPFRLTRFVDYDLEVESTAQCENTILYEVPVILEGESVLMKVVTCMK